MNVSEAVQARRSVRGFLDRPVDPALLRELALKSARAATGGISSRGTSISSTARRWRG